MCRCALIVPICLAIGCFRNHGRDGDEDAGFDSGMPDSGVLPDADVRPDGGVIPDGGTASCEGRAQTPDVHGRDFDCGFLGLSEPCTYCLQNERVVNVFTVYEGTCECPPPAAECRPVPLANACYPDDSRGIIAGRPSTLPIHIGPECFCAEALSCTGRIVEPGRLALTLEACDTGIELLCEECDPAGHLYPATCELPALTEGTWDVTIDGFEVMQLDVWPTEGPPIAVGGRCVTPGTDTGCGEAFPWPAAPITPTRLCHPGVVSPHYMQPVELTIDTCDCNFHDGPCDVSVQGDQIVISPTSTTDPCSGDCFDPVCFSFERTCWLPRLDEGTYRVRVGDTLVSRLEVTGDIDGLPPMVCTGVDS